MTINIPYFNEIDSDDLNDYYCTTIVLDSREVELDLNFKNTVISTDKLSAISTFLNNIPDIVSTATNSIYTDLDNDDEVRFFVDAHMEELDENDIARLLKDADKSLSIERQILSVIHLKRIGFYPEKDDYFAVLDFGFDTNISQYLIVVIMNNDRTVNHITVES